MPLGSELRKKRNSSKVNLAISLGVHALILGALVYFAAREGFLGKQIQKITVTMVKEKPPEKPKEPEKPPEKPPEIQPKPTVQTPQPPREVVAAPPPSAPAVAAPPAVAPPAVDVPAFVFEGGKPVETSSDPVQLYKGFVENALRAKWNRPENIADDSFVAEIEVSIDRSGGLSNPAWLKNSGNQRWDDSVRKALAATTSVNRAPPANFPPRFLVRFDVREELEPVFQ